MGKDYKKLYIDMLKQYDYAICDKCKNQKVCKEKNCKFYEHGDKAENEHGHTVDYEWDCTCFTFGTCRVLEYTPCNGCFENGVIGFELKDDE